MAAADLKYKLTCFLGIDKGMFSYINYQACIEWSFIYDGKNRTNHQTTLDLKLCCHKANSCRSMG